MACGKKKPSFILRLWFERLAFSDKSKKLGGLALVTLKIPRNLKIGIPVTPSVRNHYPYTHTQNTDRAHTDTIGYSQVLRTSCTAAIFYPMEGDLIAGSSLRDETGNA